MLEALPSPFGSTNLCTFYLFSSFSSLRLWRCASTAAGRPLTTHLVRQSCSYRSENERLRSDTGRCALHPHCQPGSLPLSTLSTSPRLLGSEVPNASWKHLFQQLQFRCCCCSPSRFLPNSFCGLDSLYSITVSSRKLTALYQFPSRFPLNSSCF